MMHLRACRLLAALGVLALSAWPAGGAAAATSRVPATQPVGIHKIQHVVVIMQENRSFDSYFGTFPGADGIPMRHGRPTVCVPDPVTRHCVRPFHDRNDRNLGGRWRSSCEQPAPRRDLI